MMTKTDLLRYAKNEKSKPTAKIIYFDELGNRVKEIPAGAGSQINVIYTPTGKYNLTEDEKQLQSIVFSCDYFNTEIKPNRNVNE